MDFDSFKYVLLFLPVVFLICQLARRSGIPRLPQVCILVASVVFYGWHRPFDLVYLGCSVLVNWFLARMMVRLPEDRRKPILQLGLILNVLYLSTFKYVAFFAANLPLAIRGHIHVPSLRFPLGISFFTLTQIMYLVDCYEELSPASSLFDHITFVSFFPYVISGPISRSRRILHQFPTLNGRTSPTAETLARAIYLFSIGLSKKVVLSEAFSQVADAGFGNIANLSSIESWISVSAYTLQLYFDFSGYSDMAIASALLFGIEVPRNFDAPLRSLSIVEFWQRWHITLSGFITTYLYTPILKSFKKASLETAAIATLTSMAIAGLWHGASWNYVIFGVVHGLALVINQYWKKKKMPRLPKWLSWVVTFAVVDLGFVYFRSPDLATAGTYLRHLVGMGGAFGISHLRTVNGNGAVGALFLISQVIGIGAAFFGRSSDQMAHEFIPSFKTYAMTAGCILVAFLFLNSNVGKPFVYFGF